MSGEYALPIPIKIGIAQRNTRRFFVFSESFRNFKKGIDNPIRLCAEVFWQTNIIKIQNELGDQLTYEFGVNEDSFISFNFLQSAFQNIKVTGSSGLVFE
ncbi:MAG: hypothetical protein RR011_04220, partial [Oscillospiraceae bacterium]